VIVLDETQFKENSLKDKKIVVTGALDYFTKSSVKETIIRLGGRVQSNFQQQQIF
jgi:NAD-dependent DNA ligase